jgi:DNA-binding transcriptional LysR family regulator
MIDEGAAEVVRSVVSGVPDFGLNFIGAQEAEIDFKAIYTERFLLAVQADHPLAQRERVSWNEVSEERFISVSSSSGNRMLIDNALTRVEKPPVIFYETNHLVAALGLVAAGLGVAAVPGLAFSRASHPTLVGVPLVNPVITRTLGLISKKGRKLSPAAQALYTMLANSTE